MTSSKKLVCRHQQHLILAVKHGGGVMIWDCFTAMGPGHLALIQSTMNSFKCEAVSPTAKAWPNIQQVSDSKHRNKSTIEKEKDQAFCCNEVQTAT